MIYIIIEINGLKILSKLKKDLITRIKIEIENLFHSISGIHINPDSDTILYKFDPVLVKKQKLLEFCFSVRTILLEAADELQGFNILLDIYKDGSEKESSGQIRNALYQIMKDKSFFLGMNAAGEFLDYAEVEETSGLFEVVSLKQGSNTGYSGSRKFLIRKKIVDQIIDAVFLISQQNKPGYITVSGQVLSGRRENVYAALRKIKGNNKNFNWFSIHKCGEKENPYNKIRAGIDYDIYDIAAGYLDLYEIRIWERKKQYLLPDLTVYHSEDFFSVFRLYILAYIRYMGENLFPPAVICEDTGSYPPAIRELLLPLLNNLITAERICILDICSNDKDCDELSRLRRINIEVNDFTTDEIAELLKINFPNEQLSAPVVFKAVKGYPVPLIHYLFLIGRGAKFRITGDPFDLSIKAAGELNYRQRIILYLIAAADGNIENSVIMNFLSGKMFDSTQTAAALSELEELFFIRRNPRFYSVIPGILLYLNNIPGDDLKKAHDQFADFLIDSRYQGLKISKSPFFFDYTNREKHIDYSLVLAEEMVGNEDFDGVEHLLEILERQVRDVRSAIFKQDTLFRIASIKLCTAIKNGNRTLAGDMILYLHK